MSEKGVEQDRRIRILDEITVCKIAAGEVITAPANVVKELVENSIDAGADEIKVEFRGSGVSLISVTDNGWGMTRDDALLALEHHATSKLREVSDLSGIATYGFRGEALPSIASISQMEIVSAQDPGAPAACVKVEGGVVKSVGQSASVRGTTITVRNLFYNTPVRRKFLKSEGYETAAIVETVTKYALTHPTVRFVLNSAGRCVFSTRGNSDVKSVIADIFPPDLSSSLIECSVAEDDSRAGRVRIEAFLAPPHLSKPSNRYQYTFVNGRPFKNRAISHAVSEAYRKYLQPRQYPVLFMFIEIDGRLVDVNIHPTKTEVAFSCEPALHGMVERLVEKGLSDYRAVPAGAFSEPAPPVSEVSHFQNELNLQETVFLARRFDGGGAPHSGSAPGGEIPPALRAAPEESVPQGISGRQSLRVKKIIGQAFNSFIIAEDDSGLVLIDQHVAAEKVAYEKILESLRAKRINSQALLIPHVYTLNRLEFEILSCSAHLLEKYGFDIEAYSNNSVAVRAVPDFVGGEVEKELLFEIISSGLSDSAKFDEERFIRKLAASLSCRGAVKAGKAVNQETAGLIVEELQGCENPFFCPHGRPVVIRLPLSEILQKFKRTI